MSILVASGPDQMSMLCIKVDDCFLFLSLQIDLNHNRIPFVTNKMFPEHKWIPYKLEKLDLSHNRMPVITKEMLVGTKHLKHLNVSYNILTDIRRGIFFVTLRNSFRFLQIFGVQRG